MLQILEATTTKRMNVDPYYHGHNSPLNVLFNDVFDIAGRSSARWSTIRI